MVPGSVSAPNSEPDLDPEPDPDLGFYDQKLKKKITAENL
jgi:hypothetical protein